jgi:hypothetical protein
MVNFPGALSVGSSLIQPVTVAPLTCSQPCPLFPVTVSGTPSAAVPRTFPDFAGWARTFKPIGLSTVRTPLAWAPGAIVVLVVVVAAGAVVTGVVGLGDVTAV